MVVAAGYVLNVAKERRAALMRAIESEEIIAEAVPDFVHSTRAPLICFVGFKSGAITHLADGRRGVRAGTGLRRLNLRHVVALPRPILHGQIKERVPRRVRSHISARLAGGGLLPPASFAGLVDTMRALSPASRVVLDRFSQERRERVSRIGEGARRGLAYQKEAIATALAIAGLDRRVLQEWEPPAGDGPISFLDGLPVARMREDVMIVNDMAKIPGFELVRHMPYGAAVFEGEAVRLTVVLANRLPLEKQFGTDLIYYNETYKSFVLVQYKAMERADDEAVYRLPDQQLAMEIMRMERAALHLRDCPANVHRDGFRLMENPFFLKLCPRVVFK